MAHMFVDSDVGQQRITTTSTTQSHPLGKVSRAVDTATNLEGEYIYLKGVASTIVGSIVNYDADFQTALETTALNKARPNAIAMSANVASQYGWYQIGGVATAAKANTLSLAAGTAIAATSGLVVAVVSGLQIGGALVAVVASAKSDVTTVKIMVNRPQGPRN